MAFDCMNNGQAAQKLADYVWGFETNNEYS